jgi:hypothetical protein
MEQDTAHRREEAAPTSSATTAETEPEVVAGISSAEGNPNLPTAFRTVDSGLGFGWMMLLLAAGGVALGYGLTRWLRRGA